MNDFVKIQNKIITEEKHGLIDSAIMTADILAHYDEEIRGTIIRWADGEDVTKAELCGTSVEETTGELNCSVFQALCLLNALKHDPEAFADAVLVKWEDDFR